MALISVDLTDIRGMSRYDQRSAYGRWAEEKGINTKTFPFEGEKTFIKGKDRQWIVSGFGDYRDASGNYRRFIAYRCGLGTLSRMYSWVWDAEGQRWNECAMQGFGSW